MNDYLNYLAHHGIKGQKWGIRRYQNEDGTYTDAGNKRRNKKLNREAKKDAKEYARAKMYYGEGAGNRRKLINAKVNERSKDPEYKKRFEEHLSRQDMGKHAEKAKKERAAKDAKNYAGKTWRTTTRLLMGTGGVTIAAAAAYYASRHPETIKKVIDAARNINVSDIIDRVKGKHFVRL